MRTRILNHMVQYAMRRKGLQASASAPNAGCVPPEILTSNRYRNLETGPIRVERERRCGTVVGSPGVSDEHDRGRSGCASAIGNRDVLVH